MNPLPKLSLAPMQDVSVLPLWRCLERRGGPDLFVTEYFRVHRDSHPERKILDSILEMSRRRPVRAQMIGNTADDLVRTAREIQDVVERAGAPLEGLDLNLGCPSPKVCGKAAGGALLRDPDRIRGIVLRLREVVAGRLSLKTRVGFESVGEFDDLLGLFRTLPIDELAIHARTVREKYRTPIHPECIARAVEVMPCPVVANGNIVSVGTAEAVLGATGAAGLMIGRGAIRNPWLFRQVREFLSGEPVFEPTRSDLRNYLSELADEVERFGRFDSETALVNRLKKFTNYIASGLDEGRLQDRLRRTTDRGEFETICSEHLRGSDPLPHEPLEDGTLFCGFRELVTSGVSRSR